MKPVIKEISRIKSLMSIKEQEEINDNIGGTVIIGDYFAQLVSNDIQTIPFLVDDTMTVDQLIKRLSSSEIYENVTNLILTIGTVDFFKGLNSINLLCDLIYEIFPNANYYVFKGVISDFEIESEKEIEDLERSSDIFYDEFNICGFEIVGNHPIMTDVTTDVVNPAVQELIEFVNEIDLMSSDIESSELSNIGKNIAKKSISDDETDFDTIYEFLEQFEKILKSKKTYDSSLGSSFAFDIMQIQITLNFLIGSDLEINGKYDNYTEEAVAEFQSKNGLEDTGICDPETLEEMFYTLKIKGFDDEDLAMFLQKDVDKGPKIMGILDISSAGLNSEQRSNVELMIKYMEKHGITNAYAQVGILSVIGKECGFVPKSEGCYDNTDDSRIREIFGDCRMNDEKLIRDFGMPLSELKKDCVLFFDAVYGPKATGCLGWETGNTNKGDGYKYRGRGFNQITFKASYKKYGDKIGIDLVSNPDKLNDLDVAAEAAILFLTKGQSIPDFKSKEEATTYFVNVNAGGLNTREESRQNAFEWMDRFEVK